MKHTIWGIIWLLFAFYFMAFNNNDFAVILGIICSNIWLATAPKRP